MKKKSKWIGALVLLTAGAALLTAFPLEAPAKLGEWLRALSLSGGGGNAAAWAIVLALTALPALGLLWRGRSRWDWLLLLAGAEIFFGLYFLVNPTLLTVLPGMETMWGLACAGSTAATALAWAVLRGLERLDRSASLGRALERLLTWSALLLGWLAAWSQCAGLLEKIRTAAEGNTAPDAALGPTYGVLCLLAAADLAPTLLGCGVLAWAGKLARALEADPFGAETVALAARLSRRCRQTAAIAVLLCAGGNLLQMLLFPLLHAMYFSVSFPFATVLLAAALDLLCRYFQRAKAVSDDNDTII